MEENRRFSWSGLFIKVIIVIIFILFTIWLLSLSNNGMSNSFDVLTNSIFSQNMEKMKEVGKEYFTTERLPQKVGEVETLTLKEMYEKKLILELTDKSGNACSAKDSYVSVEKYDDEYQMKVYLECGEESDYIIVIMGCYDYCETDICEKVEDKENLKQIEYQYVKTTGGSWTDYGKWSDWSKVSVTKNDYRQVETKKVSEEYTYDKTVTDIKYVSFEASCPDGYTKTSNGKECYKLVGGYNYENPVCPILSGYTLTGRNGFTCSYSAISVNTQNPVCPTVSGYTLTGRNGFTCNYSKNSTETTNPVCPTVSGYTLTGRDGFTCNYSKNNTETTNPVCPTISGYTLTGRDGFTCNYSKYGKGDYLRTETGSIVPGNTTSYIYEEVGSAEYVYDCNNGCAFRWIHTYKVYKAKVEKTTKSASCPTGYTQSGSTCTKGSTETTTRTASCLSGYTKSGSTCVKGSVDASKTITRTASCPTGTIKSGTACYKVNSQTITGTASCPTGTVKSGNTCYKYITYYDYEDVVLSCPTGYKVTSDNDKCYKNVETVEKVTETRDVTYYRYRVREYKGGTADYKWSKSKEDKELLNAGYKLTGKTR